mgnify:CR=1 FL=1
MIDFIKDIFGFAKDSRGLVKDVQDEKEALHETPPVES